MTMWWGTLTAEVLLPQPTMAAEDRFAVVRHRMVAEQLVGPGRNITNAPVLAAMGKVPRHEFVPERLRSGAYLDCPLPIGHDQTISQPFIVAFMTEQLEPNRRIRFSKSHRLRVPGCCPGRIGSESIIRLRSSKIWLTELQQTSSGSVTPTYGCALVMATKAGPKPRRLTR